MSFRTAWAFLRQWATDDDPLEHLSVCLRAPGQLHTDIVGEDALMEYRQKDTSRLWERRLFLGVLRKEFLLCLLTSGSAPPQPVGDPLHTIPSKWLNVRCPEVSDNLLGLGGV